MELIKRRIIVMVLFILCLLSFAFWGLYSSKYMLQTTLFAIQSEKVEEPIRIVHLSDNHNSVFGENNRKFFEQIQEACPDIILITGDLINSDDISTKIATDLIFDLCGIAPVYISLGNHEVEYQQEHNIDISNLYEEAGAKVLDCQFVEPVVNGQKIRLGGIYGYCVPAKYLETNEADPEECAFLMNFQDTDLYSVLMCHIPVCWIENNGLNEWDISLVLAGHAHGGQIRLPFIGGVWAPDQGWFPGKESGLYHSSDAKNLLVLSRGLGSNEILPRFNNTPEIVVVDIIPE